MDKKRSRRSRGPFTVPLSAWERGGGVDTAGQNFWCAGEGGVVVKFPHHAATDRTNPHLATSRPVLYPAPLTMRPYDYTFPRVHRPEFASARALLSLVLFRRPHGRLCRYTTATAAAAGVSCRVPPPHTTCRAYIASTLLRVGL